MRGQVPSSYHNKVYFGLLTTMLNLCGLRRWYPGLTLAIVLFLLLPFGPAAPARCSAEHLYALNLYAGRLTSNHWEEFFSSELDFKDSYLVTAALARRIGAYEDKASFEIEGQIVKHFNVQTHLELNALFAARWEAFWWDDVLDTSVAFGLGPSYATDEPEIETEINGNASQFLIYWMLELALGLPDYPRIALITRIHHRSDAFGLIPDGGGSNALAFGLKWRF
jgi:hypothetical protein